MILSSYTEGEVILYKKDSAQTFQNSKSIPPHRKSTFELSKVTNIRLKGGSVVELYMLSGSTYCASSYIISMVSR
jgi:hypothetical protein